MRTPAALAVFAHPDDESFLVGGTLAALAAAGVAVRLISLTCGERGPIARPELASAETLGAVRDSELRAAARALGLRGATCLGYPDGELRWSDAATVQLNLTRWIRRSRPEAIITFGPEGLYWHPDHIAVHDLVSATADTLSREGAAPRIYHATWPQVRTRELYTALGARGVQADLWGLPVNGFGEPERPGTITLDVRPFLAAKLQALRSHRSQLGPDHLFCVIPDDLAAEFLGREYLVPAQDSRADADWLVSKTRAGEVCTWRR